MTYDILQLQSSAEKCLQITRSYLTTKTVKTQGGWGLQQFLDEIHPGSNYIGVYGTSCGISTLLACGEPKDSPLLEKFRSWLIEHQEKEGGWTLSTFRSKDILATSTCYVLNALYDGGEPFTSPIVQDGLGWLQRTRNPDRGWGLYENDTNSKTTPSAHVISTFSRYSEMLRTQVAAEGIDWLLKSRNPDRGWGLDPISKSPSTVGHTSIVILALLAAGYPTYSSDIQEPLEWLLQRLQTQPDSLQTEIEAFYVHHADTTATGMSYHLPSASLALRAMLMAGVDPLRSEVTLLTRRLVGQQNHDGYWQDDTVQGKIPIWATLYACLALREFTKRVDAVRETLGLRQAIVDLTQVSRETQTQLKDISQKLDGLEKRVKPISTVLIFLRRYRVLIAVAVATLAYIAFLLKFDLPLYVNIGSAVLAAILTAIGLNDARRVDTD